ncbi:MAG: transcription elongation factor GreA [Thermodesulfovibrionia bacterium]
MQKIPITPEGHRRLQEELDRLKRVERPKVIKAIAEARAHGDLSENAEYHAAKERQSFIEGRIRELEDKIARAEVIDPSRVSQDRVAFGAKVRVSDIDTSEEKVFHLVGPDEIDVESGRISIHSPVARSLIGRTIGEIVNVKAPSKTIGYEILEISFE